MRTRNSNQEEYPTVGKPEEARSTEDRLHTPVELAIDGVLDLHTFPPSEASSLVVHYLEECRARGILDVRIIHGKGAGVLRETVNGVLRRNGMIESYRLADGEGGGWGATLVRLLRHAP